MTSGEYGTCEKHGRLIVAVIDVDDENMKRYCVGCIEALEAQLNLTKGELAKMVKQLSDTSVKLAETMTALEEAPNCDDCDDRKGDPPDHSWRD